MSKFQLLYEYEPSVLLRNYCLFRKARFQCPLFHSQYPLSHFPYPLFLHSKVHLILLQLHLSLHSHHLILGLRFGHVCINAHGCFGICVPHDNLNCFQVYSAQNHPRTERMPQHMTCDRGKGIFSRPSCSASACSS